MHIHHIKINSILGIDELEFEAGQFNEISGRNGEGKTSVLEAIQAVAAPGSHDATLLRRGETEGEIVLVLDDGMQLSRSVNENTSPLSVRDANGGKVSKPGDAIKRLSDALAVNPVEFLHAAKKDRVRVLLETMPINLDVAKLAKISGIKVTAQDGVHALAVIDLTRKQVYDERTGTNRAVKEKDATINQLKAVMPEVPGDAEGSEEEIRASIATATTVKDEELERVRVKLAGFQTTTQAAIDAIRIATQASIDKAKADGQALVEAEQAKLKEIEGKANTQRELTIQRHTDAVTPLNQTLSAIVANRSSHAKREQAIITIEQMEKELEDLTLDAENQTKAITAIDQYKSDLLSSLPIPGLEVRDGEIYRDDIQFDRLNTAQQVGIAVEIAKLRAGELKIICVDGLELLDTAAFEEFKTQIKASDLQLFVSRVSDEDFTVKTS